MTTSQRSSICIRAAQLALLGALTACGGGGGGGAGGNPANSPFELVSVDVTDGATWQLNRAVRLEFSRAVDPSVLASSAITIADLLGAPAQGEYLLESPAVVVFEPSCPTDLDLDAFGFEQATDYALVVMGVGDTDPVRALDGALLAQGLRVDFRSAHAGTPGGPLHDPVVGPPSPIVRLAGSTTTNASRLVIGSQGFESYFELAQPSGAPIPIQDLPLNLPSSYASQVCVALVFDQPIDPSEANLARLGLEVQTPSGAWVPVDVERITVSNACSGGIRVDVKPLDVLPAESVLRAVVDSGFRDIVGDATTARRDDFALMLTSSFPAGWTFDLFESFDEDPGLSPAFIDPSSGELVQPAKIEGGRLNAIAGFAGTGGPGGDFDLYVKAGETLVIDTNGGLVLGGPLGVKSASQALVNGVIEVRNLVVELGGVLRASGTYPLVVRATESIRIYGRVDVSGGHAVHNTGGMDLAALAGKAGPGAGAGGIAQPTAQGAAPRGGFGGTPSLLPGGVGGQGGEAAYGPMSISWMFGGGGGGGCLALGAAGVAAPFANANNGHPLVYGAEDALLGPVGGLHGSSPFVDGNLANDFCGHRIDPITSSLVLGELSTTLGGCGGGAGGDAVISSFFPSPTSPSGEYRGGAGGGGGGAIVLQARLDVVFGSNARMFANGGSGAKGQAFTANLDLGGGGGGGSGGWIVLEAGRKLDLRLLGFEAIEAKGGLGGIGGGVDPSIGAGGPGGLGIIQFHVADPAKDLLLPFGVTLATRTEPNPWVLAPTQSNLSRSLSDWIALPVSPTESNGLLGLLFAGIDPATGRPLDTNLDGQLDDLPAVLGPQLVGQGPQLPFVAADGFTLVADASALVGTPQGWLLDQPDLMRGFALVLSGSGSAGTRRHTVEYAEYDAATKRLRLTTNSSDGSLQESLLSLGGAVQFRLHPRHLLVVSGTKRDWLDPSNGLTVRFQLAPANAALEPNAAAATPWSSNLAAANLANMKFVRFEVRFEVSDAVVAAGPVEVFPAIEFLRLFAVR